MVMNIYLLAKAYHISPREILNEWSFDEFYDALEALEVEKGMNDVE